MRIAVFSSMLKYNMVTTTPLFNIKALSLAWSYNSDCPTVQKERVHNRVDTTVYLETFHGSGAVNLETFRGAQQQAELQGSSPIHTKQHATRARRFDPN